MLHARTNHHEMERLAHPDSSNSHMGRSRSAPGSRNSAFLDQHDPLPSSPQPNSHTSSRATAASTGVANTSRRTRSAATAHADTAPSANNTTTSTSTAAATYATAATTPGGIFSPDPERGNARTNSDNSNPGFKKPDLEDWDENNLSGPRTNLTILDVAALILNKQIGTGIFTTPGSVLLSTRSKSLSVGLWTIGGFWTLMFLLIYLEFGDAFPFNGGELVYLDEIYNSPTLLATILFSGFFLFLANSYGNSIQFAKHVLIAAMPDLNNSKDLDPRLVRYIAISIVTLVCLIHWHSSRAGLFLNKLVAWYKVILLAVVFIAGMVWSDKHGSQWKESVDRGSTTDGMTGMVLIFYSYQGKF